MIISQLLAPVLLIGSNTNFMVNNIPVCLEGDKLPTMLKAPLSYTAPKFITPGMGTVSVTLTPMNKTLQTENRKAILIKGMPFMTEFQVSLVAM